MASQVAMRPPPPRGFLWAAAALALWAGTSALGRAGPGDGHPFPFLAPAIEVSEGDRSRLDGDQVLVRVLPGGDGQLAAFVATRLNTRPDALAAWTRAIAELKQSRYVLAIGRLSDPPRPSDLAALTLDPRDLEALRRCRPGNCGLKLPAADITSLVASIDTAGAGWRGAAQEEFRRLLVERVRRYRAGGLASLPPPADGRTDSSPHDALSALVAGSPYLARLPHVVAWLKEYPHATHPDVESFFYWSKEQYGDGKPVISITHVGIIRSAADQRLPVLLVASKQIFASHYLEAGLGLTMVVQAGDGTSYLAYVNRSQIDLLRGFFGRLIRGRFEDRVERQAPLILRALRARLESGPPPGQDADPLTGRPVGDP